MKASSRAAFTGFVAGGLAAVALAPGCRDDEIRGDDPGPAVAGSPASAGAAADRSDAAVAQPRSWYAVGHSGVVATGQPAATAAALAILQSGGNAADAAAAAILALGVADHEKFHFGGDVVILAYDARSRSVEVIAGLGEAPRLATRQRFAGAGIPALGLLAATVPAVPDAILTLLDRHGTKSFKAVSAPMEDLLKKGKAPWHWKLERTLRKMTKAEDKAHGNDKAGASRSRGLRLASDAFYRGEIARDIARWSESKGGLLRLVDLATHVTRVEEPVMVEYRGHKIWKAGPTTQGPAFLQTLLMLDTFSFKGIEPDTARNLHLVIEAQKLAFADRDSYLGDPLFVPVPLDDLVYPYYGSLRRKLIDLDKASFDARPGDPRAKKPLLEKKIAWPRSSPRPADGTVCVVADKDGNMIAASGGGGPGIEAGETGLWLGSGLQGFNTLPGHPNVIEPGKRPRSPLSPTVITGKNGEPEYAIGVAGGDAQDLIGLQVLMNLIDLGRLPDDAVAAPRFNVRPPGQAASRPGVIEVDALLEKKRGAELRAQGHIIEIGNDAIGAPALVAIDRRRGIMIAAGDPRTGRAAAAF